MSIRFSQLAQQTLREAILAAGNVEVFAIGDMELGVVSQVTITCRGLEDRVTALLDRPRWGQVVIHNHPSGDLRPSEPDLQLAGHYGDNGIGVIIVNNAVTEANWIVEPSRTRRVALDSEEVTQFFEQTLPAHLEGFEPRKPQIRMACEVAASLSDESPLMVEAGTGTGKSLAYLIPAAMWALKNDARVVISTYTKALQTQILNADLPLLEKLGLPVRTAVLQGRNNYLCKRRAEVLSKDPDYTDDTTISELLSWSETTQMGVRSDVPFPLSSEVWEKVESDSDLTMRLRCPHYSSCHFYEAKRNASGAHLIIVNHALLMSDLSIREQFGRGLLPKFDRIILDEAHHIEQAATGAMARRFTLQAIHRATAPLLSKGRKPGALEKLQSDRVLEAASLFGEERVTLANHLHTAAEQVVSLRAFSEDNLSALTTLLSNTDPSLRIVPEVESDPSWTHHGEPLIIEILENLRRVTTTIGSIQAFFGDFTGNNPGDQPLLDLNRAHKRLSGYMVLLDAFLNGEPGQCRWLGRQMSRKRIPLATINMAPVTVNAFLKQVMWNPIPGTTATSATLSINRKFSWWQSRVGLDEAAEATHDSPFDHQEQAILALPRDVSDPQTAEFLPHTGRIIIESIQMSRGGTFVLCTSYEAIKYYKTLLQQTLPPGWPVLAQSHAGKGRMLEQFKSNPRSVLIGTDSFWEGIDVRGLGLRQVIIPRLPFRVPTDPLQEAQFEHEERLGRDPFRSLSLPAAIIKLRQGYGRLIRSRSDRGVVLILDRRIHHRAYGAVMLRSLPNARLLKRPWNALTSDLARFWQETLPQSLHYID